MSAANPRIAAQLSRLKTTGQQRRGSPEPTERQYVLDATTLFRLATGSGLHQLEQPNGFSTNEAAGQAVWLRYRSPLVQ